MTRGVLAVATVALFLAASPATARAEDPVPAAAPRAHVAAPARLAVTGSVPPASDLAAAIAEAVPARDATEPRLDGALFAGLATAGFVVAERAGSETAVPRPTAGLSPRLLRGGGVLCDVRLSF